jgi:ABC-type uncharacterized transport system auxiliary subunit
VLVGASLAAACVSGPAPKDHFYRLEVAAPSALPAPRLAGTLSVNRFRADALTNERQVLYRENDTTTEVGRLAYRRWVDSPTIMVQDQLAAYLRAAGVAVRVVTPAVRVRPDFLLSGRIARLEWVMGASPQVVVELQLAITRPGDGKLLIHQTYSGVVPVDGSSVHEAIEAFDRALAGIFARFLADIPQERPARRSRS